MTTQAGPAPAPRTRWMPPNKPCALAAGVHWSAVAIPAERGGRAALDRLIAAHGDHPGPVVLDPEHDRMYFLVPPGTPWHVPGTRLLGRRSHVVLPPAHSRQGPGVHWLALPDTPGGLISPDSLREALIEPAA